MCGWVMARRIHDRVRYNACGSSAMPLGGRVRPAADETRCPLCAHGSGGTESHEGDDEIDERQATRPRCTECSVGVVQAKTAPMAVVSIR
jgi:hypothetical protein